jgi:hypothetical protein
MKGVCASSAHPCVTAEIKTLAASLQTCITEGASAARLLSEEARVRLVAGAEDLSWRRALPVIGEGDRRVYQDFELTQQFPADSSYREAAISIGAAVAAAASHLSPNPLPPGFCFNDLILQRYKAGSRGITPHRDHLRYRALVALVIVSGDGRFCLCRDRSGGDTREIAASPGDILLMRAPGLAGSTDRPFHFLERITRERLSFGLRWDIGWE